MAIERPQNPSSRDEDTAGPNWARLRDIPLAILAWVSLAFLVMWAAGHVVGTLLVVAIAVVLSYALSPLVGRLARIMPRPLAIVLVYLIVSAALAGFIYLIVNTAVAQVQPLATSIKSLLNGQSKGTLIGQVLDDLGITSAQIRGFGQALLAQAQGVTGAVIPVISDVAGGLIDFVVITVLSIYFVANGPRVGRWLRMSVPLRQRAQVIFLLETLDRVVGGYIRGQLTLSALIGVLVGFGMQVIFHLPYAILLGLIAFVLEFIPFLGVLVSGAVCVLVALTVGPVTAALVLAYFVAVHVIEGDVVGPRIVGSAVGLHPAVSLIALIGGAELFGLFGALFAAPVAGVVQALVIAFWNTWRQNHPEQFPEGHSVSYGVPTVPVLDSETTIATPSAATPSAATPSAATPSAPRATADAGAAVERPPAREP